MDDDNISMLCSLPTTNITLYNSQQRTVRTKGKDTLSYQPY